MNVVLDADARSNIALPFTLKPTTNIPASAGVAQFFLLDDGKTGVLALGSFSASSFEGLQRTLLNGLLQLKGKGAQRLIVDVTNNGGGEQNP